MTGVQTCALPICSAYPALQGYYICSDFATANSWKIRPNGSGGWAVSMQSGVPAGIVSYGEDENAELYAVSLLGSVYKVQATAAVASGIVSEEAGVKATVAKSNIYPTLVDNSILILDLKEAYDFVKIVDISGREVMRKTLSNQLGRVSLNLPKLNAGMYLVQLTGKTVLQQKIFIAK